MILTLTIEQNSKEPFDIQVPSEQRIQDTLQVLYENKLIYWKQDVKEIVVQSARRKVVLDLECSYEQNAIYTADILRIC